MALIVSCKLLVKRIRSLFVINLDFYFFNDSVFHLGKSNLLPIFKIMSDEEERRRSTIKKPAGEKLDNAKQILNLNKEVVGAVELPRSITSNTVLMTIINELANRLFTVCAIHMEYPYVQY